MQKKIYWTGAVALLATISLVGFTDIDIEDFSIVAPVYNGEPSDAPVGTIIYDNSTGSRQFKGKADDGSFRPLTTSVNGTWYIDASIEGADVSLGTASQASYIEATNAGLSMTLNANSATAEIACASGTASEGLNCNGAAVNESIGIAFTPPSAGEYRACVTFSHFITLNVIGGDDTSVRGTFQIAESSNTSSAITNSSNSEVRSGARLASTDSDLTWNLFPVHTCGTFSFSDASEKTLRLYYTSSILGNTLNDAHLILGNGPNIHWHVTSL